ncbi:MAG: DUF6142 family protein [Lachnospiraceae bacterium]
MFKKTRLRFSDKEYTIGGVLSSVLAIIALIVLGYSIYLSFMARGEGMTDVGAYGLLALVLSFFGVVFGLLSYKEQDKRYGTSFFGTFTNGIILILLVLFILIGL